jgi:arylsulfatase A-like enzyme
MNLVTIIIDSLRADHVGINGNSWIKTPNLDALGRESVRFTRAFPESLPTVQVRKALHTGRRIYPFRNWTPYKPAPTQGWTPLDEKDATMAEILQGKGYRTALITDLYHIFRPGMNFHRGFDEWRFIRGQEFDVYRSGSFGEIRIEKYLTPKMDRNRLPAKMLPTYLRNTELRQSEEDYFAPQVFKSAVRWLEENYKTDKFFLCIDCFDPHEPFDPPQYYRDLYDPGYKGIEVILPFYSEDLDYLSEAELNHVRALYAGEVTMVDTWLGYFLRKMEQMKMMENTVVVLITDHGHLLGENRRIGKPPAGLYPELTDLVFFIKYPGQEPKIIDTFVYDHDYFPTVFHLLGEPIPEQSEGKNLWDLVEGKKQKFYDYMTSILKTWVCVVDDRYRLICRTTGKESRLYDLKQDPTHAKNIADKHPEIVQRMFALAVKDAGGEIPVYPDARPW